MAAILNNHDWALTGGFQPVRAVHLGRTPGNNRLKQALLVIPEMHPTTSRIRTNMHKLALAALTLALLCWRPSPATTQPLPHAANLQAANLQDRHDDQNRRDDDDRRNNQDRRDANGHDRDNDANRHDRDDDDANRNNDDRDHFRDRNAVGRFPRGSYSRTCRDIRIEGNSLRASCQKNNSRWKDTSLKNFGSCRGQIINDNGRLRCM